MSYVLTGLAWVGILIGGLAAILGVLYLIYITENYFNKNKWYEILKTIFNKTVTVIVTIFVVLFITIIIIGSYLDLYKWIYG